MRVTILGLGKQISEIPAQRKIVSAQCHAHSNAHKPPKTVAPTVLVCFSNVPRPLLRPQTAQNCGSYSFDARTKILTEMYCSHQNP